jgi:hypothetical protein
VRKLNKAETGILDAIKTRTETNTKSLIQITEKLMAERDAGANSPEEMDRIDDLLEARNKLSAVSVCIDNAKGDPC